ncbi:Ceramide kinase-like protein [Liparis tanakae]|uniref:Ceramide kinase-like protein n=1 Tax=Liparis tanakae TaxID=230148 RepID=A0A4Z2FP13_9TELE|nr:Ceramide kinase-like protein [Liparis tanakae]
MVVPEHLIELHQLVPSNMSSASRYLKVFINPSSHKKEAVHIYREHVAPLFKMADVRTDITGQSAPSLPTCWSVYEGK